MINKYIDHTNLKQDATKKDIEKLCNEALTYNFKSVCVNPHYVKQCADILKNSDVLVCSVIGFPLGMNKTETKVFETLKAIEDGASEIDMVINVGALIDNEYEYVLNEIKAIKEACGNRILKVILEVCLLNDEEILRGSNLALQAGADFIKTSTGFSVSGATVESVTLMKSVAQDKMEVKAAGGVRTLEDVNKMIEAGATRIGTSGGVALIQGQKLEERY